MSSLVRPNHLDPPLFLGLPFNHIFLENATQLFVYPLVSVLYTAFGVPFTFDGTTYPAPPEDRKQISDWLVGPGEQLVRDGRIKPNPVNVLPGGLEGIPEGFQYMKAGKNSAEKLVFRLQEED